MKSYFVGRDGVIIPFKHVLYTIDKFDDGPPRLKVVFRDGILITLVEKQRFIEEYTTWLDTQDSPKTLF